MIKKRYLVCKKHPSNNSGYGTTYEIFLVECKESFLKKMLNPNELSDAFIKKDKKILKEILIIDCDNVESFDISTIMSNISELKEKERVDMERKYDEEEFKRLKKKLGK